MKTIFQIHKDLGEQLPFAVRQMNWPLNMYLIVIKCYEEDYGSPEYVQGMAYKNEFPLKISFHNFRNENDRHSIVTDFNIADAKSPIWQYYDNADLTNFYPTKNYELETVFTFGKHVFKTLEEVLHNDFSYVNFLTTEMEDAVLSERVIIYIDKVFPSVLKSFIRNLNSEKAKYISSGYNEELLPPYFVEKRIKRDLEKKALFEEAKRREIEFRSSEMKLVEELKKREAELTNKKK